MLELLSQFNYVCLVELFEIVEAIPLLKKVFLEKHKGKTSL